MKYLTFILLMLLYCDANAQELLKPVLPPEDTLVSKPESKVITNRLLPEILPADEFMQSFILPRFNIAGALDERRNYYFYNFSDITSNLLTSPAFHYAANPFVRDGQITSGAEYKIGDNLIIGGNSFGVRSIFSAPLPGQNINNYDFRGSSLFMQYNISKNFRIGTHINVIHSPGF